MRGARRSQRTRWDLGIGRRYGSGLGMIGYASACSLQHRNVIGTIAQRNHLRCFQSLADRLWREGTGSATRPARWLLLADPPSIDRGELTDKNSINQRAVLECRADLVELLYTQPYAPHVLSART